MTNRIIIFIINKYTKFIKGDEEEEYTASDQQRWLLRMCGMDVHTQSGLEGGLGGWFVVGVVGMGIAAPLAVEAFMAVTRRAMVLLPIDVLCIIGGLALRFCVIWSGMH